MNPIRICKRTIATAAFAAALVLPAPGTLAQTSAPPGAAPAPDPVAPLVRRPPPEERPRQIYKWVDESGETHFGYYKPKGAAAETVDVRLPSGPAGAAPAPSEAEPPDAGAGLPAPDLSAEEKELYSVNCRIARQNLKTLERNPDQLLERDGEGNLVPVDAAQYNARKAQAQKDVDTYCR